MPSLPVLQMATRFATIDDCINKLVALTFEIPICACADKAMVK